MDEKVALHQPYSKFYFLKYDYISFCVRLEENNKPDKWSTASVLWVSKNWNFYPEHISVVSLVELGNGIIPYEKI